jgi:hypothetical protein
LRCFVLFVVSFNAKSYSKRKEKRPWSRQFVSWALDIPFLKHTRPSCLISSDPLFTVHEQLGDL